MSGPSLPDWEEPRRRLRRLGVEIRRWRLRAVLLAVLAVVAFSRGGSLYLTLGVAFAVLALFGTALTRDLARRRADVERKLSLLEGRGTPGGQGMRGLQL